MSKTIQAVFDSQADVVDAAASAKKAGAVIIDVYTPYPVHEAIHVLGLGRSRLPIAAFVFGAAGVALALWFQYWTSAIDWPLNVGGRPFNSLPAFVPVTFEMLVLCAGLGVVLTWLIVSRLYPGKPATSASPRVTDDRFVLELQLQGSRVDPETIRQLLRSHHANELTESEST
jgi:hypothetical protein